MTNNNKCRLIRSIVALLLTAASISTMAAEARLAHDWYRIELILFERHTVEATVGNERLTVDEPRYLPHRTVAFDVDDATRYELFRLNRQQIEGLGLPDSPVLRPGLAPRVDDAPRPGADSDDVPSFPEPLTRERPALAAPDVPQATAAERVLRARSEALRAFEVALIEDAYRLQPQSGHILGREAARLRTNPAFDVVWHGAWQQPVPARNEPLPVLFQAGPRIGDRFMYEGTLAVTLGRFLHLHANLWRESQDNGELPHGSFDTGFAPPRAGAGRYELLEEQRRMRSTELHYIDHPRFGLLVRIDPVSVPEQLLELDTYRDLHEEAPQ